MRPRIGITTSTYDREYEGLILTATTTPVTYARCIYAAGGMPVLLPNLQPDDAGEALAALDGLLLSGGGDIDPTCWHEAPHPELGIVDPVRDQYEFALIHEALRRDLPLFGVCRGVQVMAVATGGDLWQDIPSQRPESVPHRQRGKRAATSHTVRIASATLPARVLGAGEDAELHVSVNSFHHQAARNPGRVFTPVAWSEDGLIEALVVPSATFALGVQWHPEELAADDPVQARLFTALVSACARA